MREKKDLTGSASKGKKGLSNESATSSKGAPWKSKTPEEVNSESVVV